MLNLLTPTGTRNARGKVTSRAGRPRRIDEEERKRRARKRRADGCTTAQNRDCPRIQCGAKKNGMWKYDCRCSAEREEMVSVDTCATLVDTCLTFRFSRLVHTVSAIIIYSYCVFFFVLLLFHPLFFVFFCFFWLLGFFFFFRFF